MSSPSEIGAGDPARGARPLRIAMVGWGAIARRVMQLLGERRRPVVLVGVSTRTRPGSGAAVPEGGVALPEGVPWLAEPEALAELEALAGARIDLVIEAAGRAAVEPWGAAALRHARSFVVSSTSAFCDDGVLDRLQACAEAHGSRILVPAGALAGVDALAAASILPLSEVRHRIVKPPEAWFGTPAEQSVDLRALTRETVFFEGSAREAARAFPANANVAVITALAGIGLDRTFVQLVADPAASGNGHRLWATGAFGTMEVRIENRPLTTNPKSSDLTALALVRTIESRVLPLSL